MQNTKNISSPELESDIILTPSKASDGRNPCCVSPEAIYATWEKFLPKSSCFLRLIAQSGLVIRATASLETVFKQHVAGRLGFKEQIDELSTELKRADRLHACRRVRNGLAHHAQLPSAEAAFDSLYYCGEADLVLHGANSNLLETWRQRVRDAQTGLDFEFRDGWSLASLEEAREVAIHASGAGENAERGIGLLLGATFCEHAIKAIEVKFSFEYFVSRSTLIDVLDDGTRCSGTSRIDWEAFTVSSLPFEMQLKSLRLLRWADPDLITDLVLESARFRRNYAHACGNVPDAKATDLVYSLFCIAERLFAYAAEREVELEYRLYRHNKSTKEERKRLGDHRRSVSTARTSRPAWAAHQTTYAADEETRTATTRFAPGSDDANDWPSSVSGGNSARTDELASWRPPRIQISGWGVLGILGFFGVAALLLGSQHESHPKLPPPKLPPRPPDPPPEEERWDEAAYEERAPERHGSEYVASLNSGNDESESPTSSLLLGSSPSGAVNWDNASIVGLERLPSFDDPNYASEPNSDDLTSNGSPELSTYRSHALAGDVELLAQGSAAPGPGSLRSRVGRRLTFESESAPRLLEVPILPAAHAGVDYRAGGADVKAAQANSARLYLYLALLLLSMAAIATVVSGHVSFPIPMAPGSVAPSVAGQPISVKFESPQSEVRSPHNEPSSASRAVANSSSSASPDDGQLVSSPKGAIVLRLASSKDPNVVVTSYWETLLVAAARGRQSPSPVAYLVPATACTVHERDVLGAKSGTKGDLMVFKLLLWFEPGEIDQELLVKLMTHRLQPEFRPILEGSRPGSLRCAKYAENIDISISTALVDKVHTTPSTSTTDSDYAIRGKEHESTSRDLSINQREPSPADSSRHPPSASSADLGDPWERRQLP